MRTCDVPSGACCYDRLSDEMDASAYRCIEAGVGCGTSELTWRCDDPVDCVANGLPGTICCGRAGTRGGAITHFLASAACEAPSNCTGYDAFLLCDPTRDQCGDGGSCVVVSLFRDSGEPVSPTFRACR